MGQHRSHPSVLTHLRVFDFQGDHRVRSVHHKGSWWFVAADVCRALGMDVTGSGVGMYLQKLLADEKIITTHHDHPNLFLGRSTRSTSIVS